MHLVARRPVERGKGLPWRRKLIRNLVLYHLEKLHGRRCAWRPGARAAPQAAPRRSGRRGWFSAGLLLCVASCCLNEKACPSLPRHFQDNRGNEGHNRQVGRAHGFHVPGLASRGFLGVRAKEARLMSKRALTPGVPHNGIRLALRRVETSPFDLSCCPFRARRSTGSGIEPDM
jgi:hypothetical protein